MSTFIDACFGKKTNHIPVWYMRQAGRYLPSYRKLKGGRNILDIVKDPKMAAEIAFQPVDILGVDAAILYADIMIPLLGIGVDLEIIENIGPVIKHPIENRKDVEKLRTLHPQKDIPYLLETINILKRKLDKRVPLIGFSAAPFTLAGYLIEGKPSRDFIKTKLFMYTQPKAWTLLMEKLTELIISYLTVQKNTGIEAIQLFDSWVGFLSQDDYLQFVFPYSQKIFATLSDKKVPLIHFGTNTAAFLKDFSSVECDVVSVDWRVTLSAAWKTVGFTKAIQGNIDPVLLMADFSFIQKKVDELIASLPRNRGYIFNLGHGVLQNTPYENVVKLTQYIHTISQ